MIISFKCISLQIFTEIVENQDLYRNKDVLCKKKKHSTQKFVIFSLKDVMCLLSISIKYIYWQIFIEIVENQDLYRIKDDL